jgi:hypothetical protein
MERHRRRDSKSIAASHREGSGKNIPVLDKSIVERTIITKDIKDL